MRRGNLSKALYDVGKLTFAAIVLGQFVSPDGFRLGVFVGGALFFIATFLVAYLIDKEG